MAETAANTFSLLEERVEALERQIGTVVNKSYEQPIPAIADITDKLRDLENSDKNIKRTYSQLAELQRYLQMCHADTMEKSSSAKIDYVIASEKQIRRQADELQAVSKLQTVLDSEHLKSKVGSDLHSRLLKLSHLHTQSRIDADESLDQAKELIDNYNQAISSLSLQFERWNALVTALEEQQLQSDGQ